MTGWQQQLPGQGPVHQQQQHQRRQHHSVTADLLGLMPRKVQDGGNAQRGLCAWCVLKIRHRMRPRSLKVYDARQTCSTKPASRSFCKTAPTSLSWLVSGPLVCCGQSPHDACCKLPGWVVHFQLLDFPQGPSS